MCLHICVSYTVLAQVATRTRQLCLKECCASEVFSLSSQHAMEVIAQPHAAATLSCTTSVGTSVCTGSSWGSSALL